MKLQKRIPALLTVVVLLLAMGVTAYAHDVPDMSRTGSISVTMLYGETPVPGGALTLYRAGEIYEGDGSYGFVLAEDFAGSGASLEDITSTTLADDLAAWAKEKNLTGTEVKIGEDGTVTAGDLALGLYLVVQTEAAEGYEAAAPFVVSVPMNEDGTYVYDVDAASKVGTLTESPAVPTATTPPGSSTLPQTGQLNWPVPVLAVLGLCLLLLGWTLCRSEKGTPDEA